MANVAELAKQSAEEAAEMRVVHHIIKDVRSMKDLEEAKVYLDELFDKVCAKQFLA